MNIKELLEKSKSLIVCVFIVLLLPKAGFPGSSGAETQKESESPIHEIQRADQCSIITMKIRELSYSLKMAHKELAHFTAESKNTDTEQLVQQYAEELNLLEAKEKSLRAQIDLHEQLLQNCIHQTAMPGE